MARGFLGKGWGFDPRQGLQLNKEGEKEGEIAMASHERKIQESIWIILRTAPGERVMRPDFGCGIHEYLFAPNDTRTAGLVAFAVEEALVRWEPRIALNAVNVEPDSSDPAVLLVDIDYQVRATDTRFNLVYPFYLERGEAP